PTLPPCHAPQLPHSLFLLMRPRPPTSTLFPYTTLFRSRLRVELRQNGAALGVGRRQEIAAESGPGARVHVGEPLEELGPLVVRGDRKSTRLNSSHLGISYAVFCLKKKTNKKNTSSRCSA